MVNKTEKMAIYIHVPAGELETRVVYTIIFIIDQIETYVTIFNGFQNVC